jgi:hypothetical protein
MKRAGFPDTDARPGDGEMAPMKCPICSSPDGMHLGRAREIEGNDNSDAATESGLDVRGNVIVVPMWCEMGDHPTEIRIGFHKGQVYVQTATSGDEAGS